MGLSRGKSVSRDVNVGKIVVGLSTARFKRRRRWGFSFRAFCRDEFSEIAKDVAPAV